jgi:hypothetical protein
MNGGRIITTGEDRSSARVARWAGLLGVYIPAAAIPIYPIWLVPSTQTSGTDIARWASTHHDRLVITQVLYTVGVGLWLVFGAAVWTHLRNRLPAGSPLATGFSAGLVGLVTLILSGFTAFDLLLYRPRSAESSTLLYDLTVGLLAMSGVCAPRGHRRRRPRLPSRGIHCTHRPPIAPGLPDRHGHPAPAVRLDRSHRTGHHLQSHVTANDPSTLQ